MLVGRFMLIWWPSCLPLCLWVEIYETGVKGNVMHPQSLRAWLVIAFLMNIRFLIMENCFCSLIAENLIKNECSCLQHRGASEKIGKLLSSYNIKLASKSSNTLERAFCHLKDKVKKEDRSEIVHEAQCSDCEKVYIGESGRELRN